LKARLYQPNPEWEKAIQSVKFAVEGNPIFIHHFKAFFNQCPEKFLKIVQIIQ